MSLFQFSVENLLVGSNSPYSASFESIAARALEGVQSADFAITYPRIDAFSWDGNGTQEEVVRPRAELSFSYVFSSGVNEQSLGLGITPNSTTPALSAISTSERNYYLLVNQDNQDNYSYSGTNNRLFALGNAVISRYGFTSAVGQPSTVDVTVEGLNLLLQATGSGQLLPAVNKQSGTAVTGRYSLPFPTRTVGNYWEAAPGNIVLSFDTGSAFGALLSGRNACPIESFGFSIDLPRTEVKDLGWAYPTARPIQWPVTISIRAEAYLSDFQLDSLNRSVCPDTGYVFNVGFKKDCTTNEDFAFRFVGGKLDSQTVSSRVGGGSTRVGFNWSLKIYDIARTGLSPNFYVVSSGTPYTSIVFPQVDYVTGLSPLTFNLGTLCFLSIVSGPAILNGNQVLVSDESATTVVRAATTDGSDTKDVTVTVA